MHSAALGCLLGGHVACPVYSLRHKLLPLLLQDSLVWRSGCECHSVIQWVQHASRTVQQHCWQCFSEQRFSESLGETHLFQRALSAEE